jgi:tetratricopeptide (TPR) repeat protein
MEAQVAAALEVSDYKQVTRLLKQWQVNDPQNPLLRLYAAQLQERTNRLAAAEKNYLQLLKQTPSSKIMSQARAGIRRIQQQQQAQKAEALSRAKQVEGGDEVAILAIASPTQANRDQAIQGIAQVFNLDAYTARMKVPSGGFRIHRIGPWGEVSYYAQALKQAQAPTLVAKVSDIKALPIFQVCYFEAIDSQATVVCQNVDGQLSTISFDWSEVSGRVSGQLPIFEQVVDIGNWGKTVHKERVQDYSQVIDFHLKEREIVVRLCDRLYQYKKGTALTQQPGTLSQLNSRIQWNHLLERLSSALSSPQHNDFTQFGKGALEFVPLLPPIPANLDIDRRAPSHWDQAFHLYSSLCYLNA